MIENLLVNLGTALEVHYIAFVAQHATNELLDFLGGLEKGFLRARVGGGLRSWLRHSSVG